MKNLLYKEVKLSANITNWLFLPLAAMVLIPSYPYFVAFIWPCLGIFYIFLFGRENKDVLFTALLPVQKKDVVRARLCFVCLLELLQVVLTVPFALLSLKINPLGQNEAGIECNAAFFGLVLLMLGLYNLIFFSCYYKNIDKPGRALVWGGSFFGLYMIAAEVLVQAVPVLKSTLDTLDPATLPVRLGVLAFGALCFVLLNLFACSAAGKSFEKADL